MSSKASKQQVAMVREFVSALRDDPEDRKGRNTIQSVAREHQIPVKDLRAFRDGRDAALPAMIVNTWSKLLGTDADIAGTGSISPIDRDWYQQTILGQDRGRLEKLALYDQIDMTRPEAASALDAWADIVSTGGIGDEGRNRANFDPVVEGDGQVRVRTAMREIADQVNRNLLPDSQRLMLVRDMAKDGDVFEQCGVSFENGQPYVSRLVNMPTKTMWVKVGQSGALDPASAYAQILPGQATPSTTFPVWKIIHFANKRSRGSVYGTSIFESCLRSYIQLEAMEAAMVIRRLERAPLRMKHFLDVGHLTTEEEIKKAKENYRTLHKKQKTVDGNRNFQQQRINMPADEDYLVAKRGKDSPADIIPIEGDANIGQVTDFEHFFAKWLSGLGPPKAHLGYEGQAARSVVTDLHIVFARKGRRLQQKFIEGLTHLYYLNMVLRGIDPRKVKFYIAPPSLGTKDELIRAQVQHAHAATVRFLAGAFGQSGKMPSIPWFLKYVMNLEDDVVDTLDLVDVVQVSKGDGAGGIGDGGGAPKESIEMAEAALGDPKIAAEVSKARFLVGERAIDFGRPGLLGMEFPLAVNPFGHHFDYVARSLGQSVNLLPF